jgi:raffinose/stachyose/melibiose transport system substrate-binding protein
MEHRDHPYPTDRPTDRPTGPVPSPGLRERRRPTLNRTSRVIAIGVALGATLGQALPSVGASPAPAAGITVTQMASQEWIKPAEQELGKKFEEQTGIHIDYQIIPADQYFNVLKTKLNAGEAADIFGGQSGKSDLQLQYDVANNAVDLTGSEWTSRIDPAALDQSSLDGKVYGAEIWDTIASNYFVMVYNKDIFQQQGISVPKTFDEFAAACETLKGAGITPIYEPIADGWHQVLWFPFVGPAFEAAEPGLSDQLNANTATFAGDANMVKAMTQINQLYQSGCFGDNALSDTFANTDAAMASGKYAMTVSPLTMAVATASEFPDVKASSFGFFPIPIFDNQFQPVHPAGPTKFVYSKSAHVEQAKQYLEFLMEPENLQYLLDNTPQFASLPFTGIEPKWDADQTAFLDAYPAKTLVYQDVVNYLNPQWMDIGKDMVAMFTASMTPEDVLASIDERRAEMAAAAQDPAWQQ